MYVQSKGIISNLDKSFPITLILCSTDKNCTSAHLESLRTNIASASVSNVSIVCYIKLPPTKYRIRHCRFALIYCIPYLVQEVLHGLIKHVKINKKRRVCLFFNSFYYLLLFNFFTSMEIRMIYVSLDTKFKQRNFFFRNVDVLGIAK